MKTIILAALLAGTTTIPALLAAQTAPTPTTSTSTSTAPQGVKPADGPASEAPAVAPAIPLANPGDAPSVTATSTVPAPTSAVKQLSEGNAPASTQADTWEKLEDSTRYLMIMGAADGFAAAGPGSPCFPGENNSTLDASLKKTGFGAKDPDGLPEALTKLSAPKDKCQATTMRGYSNSLLKTMPDQHLATYLTGLVRSYARLKPCPAQAQGYAAAMVTTAIFTGADDAQPLAIIQPAIVEGCKGVPSK